MHTISACTCAMVEKTRKKVDEGDYGDISLILKQPFPYPDRNRNSILVAQIAL